MPPAALIAATAVAGGLSAGGQIIGGIQQRNAANAQANAFQAQAGMEREAAGAQIGAQDFKNNQLMAEARANAAASGVAPNSGSAKVVNAVNSSEAALQDTYARYTGNLKASQDIAEAANARLQGKQALYGSLFGAGATALTTALRIKAPVGAGGLGF